MACLELAQLFRLERVSTACNHMPTIIKILPDKLQPQPAICTTYQYGFYFDLLEFTDL